MTQKISLPQSSVFKVGTIGLLIILLLIPMSMTRGIVMERSWLQEQAQEEVMQSWGRAQTVGVPVLAVPYTYSDNQNAVRGTAYALAEDVSFDVQQVTEIRYRGLYEVPVYTARLKMTGTIRRPDFSALGAREAFLQWDEMYFALPFSDARVIRNTPVFTVGEQTVSFEAGGNVISGLPAQIIALTGNLFTTEDELEFSTDIEFAGSASLNFLPLANTTEVTLRSDWHSPSFHGAHLPVSREADSEGYSGNWKVSSLGRRLPAQWTSSNGENQFASDSAFGVDLFMPVGLYQLIERATKYAILFISLSFLTYFLFEVLANLRLHPIQYLLVGFANVLFYLLLLSLAEHIGFIAAYFISALASVAAITGYSMTVLGQQKRALIVSLMLIFSYAYLFFTLNAETYAMLAGAIVLWLGLIAVMWLTRKIDWYQWASSQNPDEPDTQV